MDRFDFMPPPEWRKEWTKLLLNKEISKSEACEIIIENAARWGFNKGLDLGRKQELQNCCAQISQCHLIPIEQREQITEYLEKTRTQAPNR